MPQSPEPAARERATAYAVCTTPRSGSNLLCDLLASSGLMGRPLEYFNARSTIAPIARGNDLHGPDGSVDMPAYIAHIREVKASDNGVFGTKILFSQLKNVLTFEAGRSLLTDPRMRYILLVRRRTISQAISAYLARELDAWTLQREEHVAKEGNSRESVSYDAAKIAAELSVLGEHNARWLEFFEVNGFDFLPVAYEDLLADPPAVCHEVCRYCGIETDHEFTLDSARVKKQGDDVNRRFRETFAAESELNAHQARPESETRMLSAGLELWEPAAAEAEVAR